MLIRLLLIHAFLISCSSKEIGDKYRVEEEYQTIAIDSTSFTILIPKDWGNAFKNVDEKTIWLGNKRLSNVYLGRIAGNPRTSEGSIIVSSISPQEYLTNLKKDFEVTPNVIMSSEEREKIISSIPNIINQAFEVTFDTEKKYYKFRYFVTYDEESKKTIIFTIRSFTKDKDIEQFTERIFTKMKGSIGRRTVK